MTTNEIIKALECCYGGSSPDCDNCPHKDACQSVFDSINQQTAEIKKLKIELKAMQNTANTYKKWYREAKYEEIRVKDNLKYYLDNNEENGVVHIPKFIIDNLVKEMTEVKE